MFLFVSTPAFAGLQLRHTTVERRKATWSERLRHVAYAGGWKKLEPLWDLAIRS